MRRATAIVIGSVLAHAVPSTAQSLSPSSGFIGHWTGSKVLVCDRSNDSLIIIEADSYNPHESSCKFENLSQSDDRFAADLACWTEGEQMRSTVAARLLDQNTALIGDGYANLQTTGTEYYRCSPDEMRGQATATSEVQIVEGEVRTGTLDSAVGDFGFLTRSPVADAIFAECKMGDICRVEASVEGEVINEVLSATKVDPKVDELEPLSFASGNWAGFQLVADPDNGCAMGLPIQDEIYFVTYANANEGFSIGIMAPNVSSYAPGGQVAGAVTFDNSVPILLSGEVFLNGFLLFNRSDGGSEEDGLEPLLRRAGVLRLSFGQQWAEVGLQGSSRAVDALWNCVSNVGSGSETASTTVAAPVATAASQASEFAFLRQGMDMKIANERLLDAGWQARSRSWQEIEQAGAGERYAHGEQGLTAVQYCSPTGSAGCEFLYTDAFDNILVVTTVGEEEKGVEEWRLNSQRGRDLMAEHGR